MATLVNKDLLPTYCFHYKCRYGLVMYSTHKCLLLSVEQCDAVKSIQIDQDMRCGSYYELHLVNYVLIATRLISHLHYLF